MIDLSLFLIFVLQVFWTDRPCKNFHLLICLAILDTEKSTLMENKFGLTEILKVSIFIHILFTSSKTLTVGANLFLSAMILNYTTHRAIFVYCPNK